MANFEGLIRQALSSQDADDEKVRQRIYGSSRNALEKMLSRMEGVTPQIEDQRRKQLELAIAKVESDYTSSSEAESDTIELQDEGAADNADRLAPEPSEDPTEGIQEPKTDRVPGRYIDDFLDRPRTAVVSPPSPGPSIASRSPAPQDEPAPDAIDVAGPPGAPVPEGIEVEPEELQPVPAEANVSVDREEPRMDFPTEGEFDPGFDEDDLRRNPPPKYNRRNPLLRRVWSILMAIAVLLVILWIAYAIMTQWPQNERRGQQSPITAPVGEATTDTDGSVVITLLEPTDLSALVTAGRGSANLINEQNRQMLRIQSLRQGTSGNGADPILLELEPGVLRQVAGKEVTVEFFAKSGMAGPAQFAVECNFGDSNACGRKRFRVGLQPERIVFSLDSPPPLDIDGQAFLAINTDITNAADTTGEGDIIDIIHVRLRLTDAER